jgi:hypothetical protein
MSSSQNPSQDLEPSADDRMNQDRPSQTLTTHGGTQEVSQHGSYLHDDSLSIERSRRVDRYRSRYVQARAEFSRDPAADSFSYLKGSAESTIESFSKLLDQERSAADETMISEAREGLKMWPVFLAFVHSTKPVETVLEADKLEGMEALGKLAKELLVTAKDHTYPTEIHSRDDWKVRLITAIHAAGTSLDDWTSDTLGRFFKLHREYSLNNLVQMERLMRAAQGTYRTRRVPRAGRGQGVKKPQKRR